jgi:hypothetical protein
MNNEPAFPSFDYITQEGRENPKGMTLRDYFAAKAMQGVFDNPIDSTADGKDYIALHAYKMADAMLKAREK